MPTLKVDLDVEYDGMSLRRLLERDAARRREERLSQQRSAACQLCGCKLFYSDELAAGRCSSCRRLHGPPLVDTAAPDGEDVKR